MLPLRSLLVLTLVSAPGLFVLRSKAGTRLDEPPVEYVLAIGKHTLELRAGEAITLPADAGGARATLRLKPTRLFDYKGLRFAYPQPYVWEFEQEDQGPATATMDGNDCTVIVHVFATRLDREKLLGDLARDTAQGFGGEARLSEVELRGKSEALVGRRVAAEVSGQPIVQEHYAIALGEETVVLTLQDVPEDPDQPTLEFTGLKQLLRETLEFPAAK